MSTFDNRFEELAGLDREILHYAALCGLDVADHVAIHASISRHRQERTDDRSLETLEGLLMLRLKVEEEMLRAGYQPPELGGW